MNNKKIIILCEAFEAFRKKRYSEAVIILEKAVSARPAEPYPYFLLCINYLLCNRFSEADAIIKKARSADPKYLPLVQLEAFLLLKSAPDLNSVLTAYIDRLERYPSDKYLNKAIKRLRNVKDFGKFQKDSRLIDFVHIPKPQVSSRDNVKDYYGKPERKKKYKDIPAHSFRFRIKYILLFCMIIAAGMSFYYFYSNKILFQFNRGNRQGKKDIPQIDSIDIGVLQYDLIDKILKIKPYFFYYSNEEILNDFNKAKRLIKDEKYNEALEIINKIGNSNANYRVKERNDFLRKFISGIEYRNYSEIPVEKVFKTPYLYIGSFVKWKGKIANLKRKENRMIFNLLVDYKKENNFSGVIDVYSEKEFKDINNGDMILLEGVFLNTLGAGKIYVVADGMRKM